MSSGTVVFEENAEGTHVAAPSLAFLLTGLYVAVPVSAIWAVVKLCTSREGYLIPCFILLVSGILIGCLGLLFNWFEHGVVTFKGGSIKYTYDSVVELNGRKDSSVAIIRVDSVKKCRSGLKVRGEMIVKEPMSKPKTVSHVTIYGKFDNSDELKSMLLNYLV